MHLLTKEEEDIEVMQSWVEVGGFPAQPEEEAKGLLTEGSSSPGPPFFLSLSTSHLILNLPPQFLHSICNCLSLFFFFRDYDYYSMPVRNGRRHTN